LVWRRRRAGGVVPLVVPPVVLLLTARVGAVLPSEDENELYLRSIIYFIGQLLGADRFGGFFRFLFWDGEFSGRVGARQKFGARHALISPIRSTTNPGKVPTFKIGDAAARTVYNRSTLAHG
jgi:hypothetical protein